MIDPLRKRRSNLEQIILFVVSSLLLEACGGDSESRKNQPENGEPHSIDNVLYNESLLRSEPDGLTVESSEQVELPHRPEPVFELRSSIIGAIRANRPEFFRFGKPKTIEFQGWNLSRTNGEIVRKKVRHTAGIREFGKKGHVTGVGTWSDQSIIISRFEYDSGGRVRSTIAVRDGVVIGGTSSYKYEKFGGSIRIQRVRELNGEVVRTETQSFDSLDRMTDDLVDDGHSGALLKFGYDTTGNVVSIRRFIVQSTPSPFSTEGPSEQWLFKYDDRGRVVESKKLTLTSDGLTGFPVSYEYDENGSIVRETYGEGPDAEVVEYTYEFDDHGNWIRQTGWPVSDDPNASGYEIERTISYYE